MLLARYVPTIVLTIWVLLLISGVSSETLRIPGMTSLGVALAIMARAEVYSGRGERRRRYDRRQR